MSHVKIIAIEGLDGVGKHTQSKLLSDRLGWELRSFPTHNGTSFANPVDGYLHGELSENPNDINPYAAAAMYAVDRYASYFNDWGKLYEQGKNFVMDRYMESNMICHLGKMHTMTEKVSFMQQTISNEAMMGLPLADIVIFLDVDPDVSQRLMSLRYNGDESKKDIHESSIILQQQFRENALFAASKRGNWEIIGCTKDGEILPIDAIHELIYSAVKEKI